jgi:hypothetical protein
MATKKKSKKIEATVAPVETPDIATPVEAVVEKPFEGRYFDGGVILPDGRWTRSLKSCKGTCEYIAKSGKKIECAVVDYRRCKDNTVLYRLVFIDRTNKERVTGTPQKDRDGNLTVGFFARMKGEQKPLSGYIESIRLFPV